MIIAKAKTAACNIYETKLLKGTRTLKKKAFM
jgi:hypothetical protein